MNIGSKIKAARIAKGLTQQELGALLGVKDSAIAKYESGRVVNIKRTTLKKISEILDIRPAELIVDEIEKQPANDDGLTETQREAINLVKQIPAEDSEMVLRILRSVLEAHQ